MITIEGSVTRTDLLLRLPIEPVTSGCRNSVFLHLRFSKFWKDYTERWVEFFTAVGKRCREKVSSTGTCVVPETILGRSGRIYLSVVGVKRGAEGGEEARAVTELVPMRVFRGGYGGKDGEV